MQFTKKLTFNYKGLLIGTKHQIKHALFLRFERYLSDAWRRTFIDESYDPLSSTRQNSTITSMDK